MEDIDIGKMPDFVYIGHEFFFIARCGWSLKGY